MFARSLIVASLVTAFSSFASADRIAEPHWAQAPARNMQAPINIDRAQIRAKLASNRAANLARFRDYQRAGVFPSNTYTPGALNVWRDADGHLCAAATIINASGSTTLVDETARDHNFIRLADVTDGPLMAWILTSGLTQAEIVAIQEPFLPVVDEPQPLEPTVVDAKLRQAENRRLIAKYKAVDAMIVKGTQKSLDAAADLIVKRPDLAAKLMAN